MIRKAREAGDHDAENTYDELASDKAQGTEGRHGRAAAERWVATVYLKAKTSYELVEDSLLNAP